MTPGGALGKWALSGIGAAVGGVAGSVVLDRVMAQRRLGPEDSDTIPLGSLRGDSYEVKTDDGVLLYAEVDEVSP